MPTRRKLILGAAALVAACGESKAPESSAAAPVANPVDMTLPASPAFALAIIAQSRKLWGMDANLVMANDDATLARGFNSGLIAFGGMNLERFLFWRSGGTRIQYVGWASRNVMFRSSSVYVVREDLPDQANLVARFIGGLKAADALMRANADEAAQLVSAQIGSPVDAATLLDAASATDVNRISIRPDARGDSASLSQMRALDDMMRDEGSAGHRPYDPAIIAASAAAAWAG